MIYGPGIPILFPIGLVAFCISYIVERFKLAYYYRMPPNYADNLNYSCISTLVWWPVFYAGFGFWMYTNCQIFDNVVKPIHYLGEPVKYGHTVVGALTTFKPGWPFLILLAELILSRIFDVTGLIEKHFYSSETKELLKMEPSKAESFYEVIS